MLKPRKQGSFELNDWDYLQSLLDSNMDPTKYSKPSMTIKFADFKMHKDEIISELKKSGYEVVEEGEFLRIF